MDIKIIDNVDGVAVIELPIEGFQNLPLNEKLLLYNLWHAGAAGDDITYDQNYRYGIRLRNIFLDLLDEFKESPLKNSSIHEKIELYTKKILINHGNHDGRSTKKFLPTFTKEELLKVLEHSSNTALVEMYYNEITQKAIFDPDFDVLLTNKNPVSGDIISESCNNFYQNATLEDVKSFNEQYPQNSTFIKTENGKIYEDVWRTGNSSVPSGRYARHLKKVTGYLKEAKKYTPDDQKISLEALILFFEEGHPKQFDDYNIKWIAINPDVDCILGFIEEYNDARGVKSLYESMVFFRDKSLNDSILKIANHAQYFEDNYPWNDVYKKMWDKVPVSNAIVQVLGCGGAGPLCWAGVNLPNAQDIKEKYGSKSILVSNVTFASRNAFLKKGVAEFIENEHDKELMNKYCSLSEPIMITLHEVIGHGSGKVSEKLIGDPKDYLRETYGSMEETRAELCALYAIWSPKLQELGVVPNKDFAKTAYFNYVYNYMLSLRHTGAEKEIYEDHDRSYSIIVQYLIDKGSAEIYKNNGKFYPRVKDYELMHKHIGDLLTEIMRIKAEGDYESMTSMIDKYGRYFDFEIRDSVISRCKSIGYASSYAYVMSEPHLIKDDSGKITDVVLKPYSGIIEQGRAWKKLSSD